MTQTRFRRVRAALTEHPESLEAKSIVRIGEPVVGQLAPDFTDVNVLSIRVPGDAVRRTDAEGKQSVTNPGELTAFVSYIDPDGQPVEFIVHWPVVTAILRHRDRLNGEWRRLRARAVHAQAQAEAERKSGAAPSGLPVGHPARIGPVDGPRVGQEAGRGR